MSSAASKSHRSRGAATGLRHRRKWWITALLASITTVILLPIGVIFFLSLRPDAMSTTTAPFTLENFSFIFQQTEVVHWLINSLLVTLSTVAVAVMVAAPAGYVLSRVRSRAVSTYALLLFVLQSVPVISSVIPLFILFAQIGLVDNLFGLTIIYVGSTVSVATWMMAAYIDSIPLTLEEAAWVDGCSMLGSFWRIVVRNSLPGVLSTAIFAFLLAWNDYLVALVFLRSSDTFVLPIGLETFFQQNATNWGALMAVSVVMLIPPTVVFFTLNRYFSLGGVSGALAGR